MSKIFYDHLVIFEKVDLEIKASILNSDEREELWQIVDEIVHSNVLTCILEKLPNEHHTDFLDKYHSYPHDVGIIDYLNEKIGENIEDIIRQRLEDLEKELLEEILKE